MRTLMKCGCVAQGTDENDRPVCVVHIGIHPGATEVAAGMDFRGRKAFCVYCKSERPSSLDLPFFETGRWQGGVKNEEQDTFYCGCRGWD